MKRAVIAILILTTGAMLFCALRSTTLRQQHELATQTSAWQMQTQQIIQLHLEKQTAEDRLSNLKAAAASQTPAFPLAELAAKALAGVDLNKLSASESEQLLAELGCNWNTTGDFLIVSKKSLQNISFNGVRDARLTAAACATLAMTPQEQATLDELMQRLTENHSAWARENIQREEPSGNTLAKYTLPVNQELSQSLSNQFASGIFTSLGNERGQLLQQHAYSWMEALGMGSGPASAYANSPTIMTVERYSQQSDQLRLTLQRANSQMQTSVSPWQPFPEEFRTLFPGGWRELAQREVFELPKEFSAKPGPN